MYNQNKGPIMKKLVAVLLLGIGIASQASDNNYPDTPPCQLPEPSPPSTPRGSDSSDKK